MDGDLFTSPSYSGDEVCCSSCGWGTTESVIYPFSHQIPLGQIRAQQTRRYLGIRPPPRCLLRTTERETDHTQSSHMRALHTFMSVEMARAECVCVCISCYYVRLCRTWIIMVINFNRITWPTINGLCLLAKRIDGYLRSF